MIKGSAKQGREAGVTKRAYRGHRRALANRRRTERARAELRQFGVEPITPDQAPTRKLAPVGTASAGTHGGLMYCPGQIAFSLLGGGVYLPGK